ncbi:unnamed protein product [Caenorhabditis nigoni]|uniref:Uncharacterized protein n=1 Tax=Caenorhabditis nigoni TaxID=1611254 RepID=A0A2G5V907_9PELO|nr:hypothetical protein B9Z55_007289 [Caenorhabditis nigoni]
MSLYAYGGNGGYGGGGDRFGGRRDVAFEAQYQALLLELRQTHARLEMLLALTRHKDERLEGLEADNENLVSEVAQLKEMIHKQRAQVEIAEAISEQLKDELKVVYREKEALQSKLKGQDEEIGELREKLQKEADGAGDKIEEKLQREADGSVNKKEEVKKVPEAVKGEDTNAEGGNSSETKENGIKEEGGKTVGSDGAGAKEDGGEIKEKVPEDAQGHNAETGGDKVAEGKTEGTKRDDVNPEDEASHAEAN